MGKWASDTYLDKPFEYLKANCDKRVLCSAQPATFAEATSTYALADDAMATSDFTIGNGDVSGRKVAIASHTGVAVDSTGVGTHLAYVDTANSALIIVTTTASVSVDSSGTVDIGPMKDEDSDPS